MNGNETITSSKSTVWTVVAVIIVVIAAAFYLWRYGNPFGQKTPAVTITITNCDLVTPEAVVLTDGETLAFVNNDGNAHHIFIGGEKIGVPAKGSAELKAKFQYGTGTYGYACDGKLTQNQIVLVPVPGSAALIQVTFKSAYDGEPAAVQSCLKSALGGEFDKAYGDANYVPSNDSITKVNACFAPAQPATQK